MCCILLAVLMPLYVRIFILTVGFSICKQIVNIMSRSCEICLSVLDFDLIQTDLLLANAEIGIGLSKFKIVLFSV